jgi:hypothetical protein
VWTARLNITVLRTLLASNYFWNEKNSTGTMKNKFFSGVYE